MRLEAPIHKDSNDKFRRFNRLNLNCNYTFPIDLAPNGIASGAKSIGKLYLQCTFGFYSVTIFTCRLRHTNT